MFDWNDEELTNIIWGDDGETDDHIVPFKERSELQRNRKGLSEESKIRKPAEQKTTEAKLDLQCRKVESSSNYIANEGITSSDLGLGSWPESPLSKAAKTDQESSGIEVSNCLAESAKFSSICGDNNSQPGEAPDIFHATDESKDQGDFVDYSWANIGSFDDLDRMFSNEVPIFGNGSLSSMDELWSSCNDLSDSPLNPFPSTLDSQNLGVDDKTNCEEEDGQKFSIGVKVGDLSFQSIKGACGTLKHEQYPGLKGQPSVEQQSLRRSFDICENSSETKSGFAAENFSNAKNVADKAYRQKKLLKFPKRSEGSKARAFQDIYGSSFPSGDSSGQFGNHPAPSVLHSSAMTLNHQRKLQGSEISQYPLMSNPYMAASGFRNLTSPYPAMPVLSTVPSPDLKAPLLRSSFDFSSPTAISVNNAADASPRPLAMTPQEKVEKLRRRQQMRAMLAIQRQQQHFRHQVPGTDQSVTQNCPQDNRVQLIDRNNLEELTTAQPSCETKSPLEQEDSGAFAASFDDNSEEFSVLYRLQDAVAKLDMGIRLCIRDSLFRLAGSTVQRRFATDTTSTNISSQDDQEVMAKEEARKSDRYAGMPDTETVTNPIDRTVAHLLFHRPLEVSAKHPEAPDSPASAKMGTKLKRNFPVHSTTESSVTKRIISQEGPADSLASTRKQIDQFETILSESTPIYGSSGTGGGEVEASQ